MVCVTTRVSVLLVILAASVRQVNTMKTYEEIRHECLASGILFEDPDFPAEDKSLFYSRAPPRQIEWKRPAEITDSPKLFVDGASRFDVKRGALGDSGILAAVTRLYGHKELIHEVVPPEQSFTDGYAGIFRFRFWRFGKWVDVVIDDRLPTYNGRLVFLHSDENSEFWTALLEKAYAKLAGCYEAIRDGSASEDLEDFTGCINVEYDLRKENPRNLFQIMQKAFGRSALMGCSIEAKPNHMEAQLENGLKMGHAYSITSVDMIDIPTGQMKGKLPMVRVRNPWGNEHKWKGAWSDQSSEWKFIAESERNEIGLTFSDDGEFWMAFTDFIKNFMKLEICHLGKNGNELDGKRWEGRTEQGSWTRNESAGGCRNYIATFASNPQYRVKLEAVDDDDDDSVTLIVGLMQIPQRQGLTEGRALLTCGYIIYEEPISETHDRLEKSFFMQNKPVARSPFSNLREVSGQHKLRPGNYVIVPSTFEPNQEGVFVLRMLAEKGSVSKEMDEETGISDVQPEPAPSSDAERAQEEGLRSAFRKMAGEDLKIDAYELQGIFNAVFKKELGYETGFAADTCRSLVAMMDDDQSGKLGFREFKKLSTDLRLWKGVFSEHDKDKSGNLNSFELREAFHAIGMRVSNSILKTLVLRYSRRDGKIYIDDFIHCVVRLRTMFDVFKQSSTGRKAEFELDEFIQATLYC